MTQLSLDQYTPARSTDPDTSHEAARSMEPRGPSELVRRRVYDVIKSFGPAGCISDEVLACAELADLNYGTITPRYRQLINKGLVRDTGNRKPGVSGRSQRIMVAV